MGKFPNKKNKKETVVTDYVTPSNEVTELSKTPDKQVVSTEPPKVTEPTKVELPKDQPVVKQNKQAKPDKQVTTEVAVVTPAHEIRGIADLAKAFRLNDPNDKFGTLDANHTVIMLNLLDKRISAGSKILGGEVFHEMLDTVLGYVFIREHLNLLQSGDTTKIRIAPEHLNKIVVIGERMGLHFGTPIENDNKQLELDFKDATVEEKTLQQAKIEAELAAQAPPELDPEKWANNADILTGITYKFSKLTADGVATYTVGHMLKDMRTYLLKNEPDEKWDTKYAGDILKYFVENVADNKNIPLLFNGALSSYANIVFVHKVPVGAHASITRMLTKAEYPFVNSHEDVASLLKYIILRFKGPETQLKDYKKWNFLVDGIPAIYENIVCDKDNPKTPNKSIVMNFEHMFGQYIPVGKNDPKYNINLVNEMIRVDNYYKEEGKKIPYFNIETWEDPIKKVKNLIEATKVNEKVEKTETPVEPIGATQIVEEVEIIKPTETTVVA
jgi:hypothetical protein